MLKINRDKALISRIIGDFEIRLQACFERDGRHFERMLADFKLRLRNQKPCDNCNTVHGCNCGDCLDKCQAIADRLEDEMEMSDTSTVSAEEDVADCLEWEEVEVNLDE